MTTSVEGFSQNINQNQSDFNAAYNNYKLCYSIFNINGDNSDAQCSAAINKGTITTCNDCMVTSETQILEIMEAMKNIPDAIQTECDKIKAPNVVGEVTQKQKDDLVNLVNDYNTMHGSLVDSVELYKTYRIYILSEVVKLLVILAIIFYLLKTTRGVKTLTFISAIVYISLSSLNVFYTSSILFIFSIVSFFVFVVFAIMNINDISINYQNIANNTRETLTNISAEFKKDVNVL
jgi:hypothetical protein